MTLRNAGYRPAGGDERGVEPWLEERVVAFALGHPGLGPRRIAALT